MAPTRLSLAQKLAQLEDPTPIEIDPDEEYIKNGNDDDDDGSQDEAMERNETAHYVHVERSTLRGLHESLNETKYAGRKINRDLGQEASTDEEVEEDDDQHMSEEESKASEMDDAKSPSSSEEDSENSDAESKQAVPNEDKGELSNVLRRAKEADRLKGKAISRQLAIWDRLLDARIRLHKSSTLCNTLPSEPMLSALTEHEDGNQAVKNLLAEALSLSSDLFQLQQTLIAAGSVTTGDENVPPRKKRKLETTGNPDIDVLRQGVKSHSEELVEDEKRYHPHLLATLQKWSAKVQAVSPANLLPSSRGAFRTNQNAHMKPVTDLIQEALADQARAVGRTRLRRGPPRIDAGGDPQLDIEGKPLQTEEIELFDDADFYQQLLREVIEGKAVNGYDENELWSRPKKIKKQVDTRASKGRKLR
ncbi:rRNA-processing protein bfr2, partial [Serendipita sp. 398]